MRAKAPPRRRRIPCTGRSSAFRTRSGRRIADDPPVPWDEIHRRWAIRELDRLAPDLPEAASFGLGQLRLRSQAVDFGTLDDRQALAELRAAAAASIRADPSRWPRPTAGRRLKLAVHALVEATAIERAIRRRRGQVDAETLRRSRPAAATPTVVHAIHALTRGGAQQLVADLATDPGSGLRHEIVASKVPFPRVYPGLRAAVLEHPTVPEIRSRLRRVRADLLHLAHYHHPTDERVAAWYDAAARAARLEGLPILQSNLTLGDPWLDPADLSGDRGPGHALVCCSRWSLDASSIDRLPGRVVHPGTDLAWFGEHAHRARSPESDGPSRPAVRRVGFAARLDGDKFDDSIAETFLELLRRDARLEVVIAGDGGLRSPLEQRFRAKGLADRIEFLGAIPFEDLPAFYASLDVAVAPMSSDTFGSGSVHAIASGTPVAGFGAAALPEILVHPAAIAGEGDSIDLAERILALLKGEALHREVLRVQQENAYGAFDLSEMRRGYAETCRRIVRFAPPGAAIDDVGSIAVVTTIRNDIEFVDSLVEAVPTEIRSRVRHVIADGGSEDGTFEALQSAARSRPHLQILPRTSVSMAAGLNRAIEFAESSHVVVLNADDGFEPGGLEALLEAVEVPRPPALVVGGLRVLDGRGETFRIRRVRRMRTRDILLDRDYPWNPSCMAYARSLHRIAGSYDEGEPLFDLAFLLRISESTSPTRIDDVVGRFNMRDGSLTVRRIESGELDGMIEDLFRRFEQDLPPATRAKIMLRRGLRRLRRRLGKRI